MVILFYKLFGNTNTTARIVVEIRVYDIPVLTGNSLKHWHSVYLAEVYITLGGKHANELCKAGIGLRGYKLESTLDDTKAATSENEAIEDVCNDIHGFLITIKGQGKIG